MDEIMQTSLAVLRQIIIPEMNQRMETELAKQKSEMNLKLNQQKLEFENELAKKLNAQKLEFETE